MQEHSARPVTGGLRPNVLTASLVVALVAVAWFVGTWSTTGARTSDFDRLAELARLGALGALLGPWTAFASATSRVALLVDALQLACTLLVVLLAHRASRSVVLATVAGLLTLASPLPEHWFARPAGAADGLAVLGTTAFFATVLDARAGRVRLAASAGAALVAVGVSGWAIVPIAAAAAVVRSRAGAAAVAASVAAVVVRVLLGMPVEDAAGRFDAAAPLALPAVRSLVALAFATPAAVFALTRPRAAAYRVLSRTEWALLAAAAASLLVGGALADPWPAVFCAQVAITLGAAAVAGRVGYAPAPSPSAAAAIAVAILAAGFVVRPPAFPADDAADIARDAATVRAAGDRFTVVDHGDAALRRRYAPAVIVRLAGRPVEPTYADAAPRTLTQPVLDATPDGLVRIDDDIRRIATLEALRAHMRFDLSAAAASGVLSSRRPMSTPGGLGVVPHLPLAAPFGPLDATVVVSGFSLTFPNVALRPGDRLAYVVAKALPIGSAARGTVVVEVPGERPLRIADDLPPAPATGALRWRLHVVALPVRAPVRARIRFEASSPSGNSTGDWVAYGEPAVVAR
jgi:hypothetical protein